MARNSIRDYSNVNSSNTDIQSIDISEGCSPAGINNAIREVMADLKDVSTGAVALESPAFDSASLTGDLTFGDSDKCIFGAGSDLQIYHDGFASYIKDAGTGNLIIEGANVVIDGANGNRLASFVSGGRAELHYDGAEKLRTTSTGVDVTGNLTATTFQANAGGTFTTASGNDLNIVYPANRSLFIKEDTQTHVTVDNTGNVALNGSVRDSTRFTINGNVSNPNLQSWQNTTSGVTHFWFRNPNGIVGSIVTSGSSTAYNTSSDYRLKTAVNYDWDATTRLKQLRPARFKWIADGDDAVPVDGFLAHEVEGIVPESVTGTKDAMRDEEYEVTPAVLDEDGNVVTPAVMGTRSVPDYQGIDQSKLVPLLVKTIQELEARITALEAN